MCENFEEYLKNIVKNSNDYMKIYGEFKIIFDVSNVEIWKYDTTTNILSLLANTPIDLVPEPSITKKVLVTKNSIFTNHVVSEKKYNLQIDNINSYKIKSMLIVPILKDNEIIGLIRLYRNIDKKKNFSSKDIANVSLLMPMLSKLVLKMHLTMDDVLVLNAKVEVKPKATKKMSVDIRNTQTLQEKKFETEKQKFETEKQKLELEKEELEQKCKKYQLYMEESKKSIELLTNQLNLYETTNIEQQKKVLTLENDKNNLSIKFNELKRNYNLLEKVSSSKDNYSELDTLLSKIYTSQNENENFMTLLEFSILMDDFKRIPKSIEEDIQGSKIVNHILSTCPFTYDAKKEEKHEIETFLNKIQSYCQTVLEENNKKLKVFIKRDTPKSLVFPDKVVESVISRCIIKAQKFLNDDTLHLKVSFKEKELSIELNFKIEKENKFMKFFQPGKDILNDKNDMFTKFNNKLLKPINGEIHTKHEEDNYNFLLKVPAVIIKL